MSLVVQNSISRGKYREPVRTISTTDVHAQIVVDRPDPIKIGFAIMGDTQHPPLPPQTGYGEGSLFFVLPSTNLVNLGSGYGQLWINSGTTDSDGNVIWYLFQQINLSIAGGSGGDSGGSGGGDGGDG